MTLGGAVQHLSCVRHVAHAIMANQREFPMPFGTQLLIAWRTGSL